MQYLALIYANEKEEEAKGAAWAEKIIGEYMAYGDWLKGKGVKYAGDALQPTATATTVRVRDGKTLTTDGPFAETKEQLGGYYLFDAKDLDEAIEIASRIPTAKHGCVEIRPVVVFS
jgi:hypothetical protein